MNRSCTQRSEISCNMLSCVMMTEIKNKEGGWKRFLLTREDHIKKNSWKIGKSSVLNSNFKKNMRKDLKKNFVEREKLFKFG